MACCSPSTPTAKSFAWSSNACDPSVVALPSDTVTARKTLLFQCSLQRRLPGFGTWLRLRILLPKILRFFYKTHPHMYAYCCKKISPRVVMFKGWNRVVRLFTISWWLVVKNLITRIWNKFLSNKPRTHSLSPSWSEIRIETLPDVGQLTSLTLL